MCTILWTPTLFLEFHGTEAGVQEQTEMVNEIAREWGGSDFQWATRPEERNRLWEARHTVYEACLAMRPGTSYIATDVCVPISRLADAVIETKADIEETGLVAPIVGHVGDGNYHVSIMADTGNAEEMQRIGAFIDRLNNRAIAMDGTCTGEHGVGQGKMAYLEDEFGPALDLMRAVKRAVDPDNIMNPGKIFIL